jgi:GNAT superfamily N-acetyltransferase
VLIRELGPDDTGFLQEMLYEALFWSLEKERLPRELVLAHPEVTRYHEGWGRPGDLGLVAEIDGRPAGAVWCRLFTEDDHDEGYVDEETPELAIAVAGDHRGAGVGTALMEAMHARARAEGVARISLSVEDENPARRLYARLGYVAYSPDDGLGRMVREL